MPAGKVLKDDCRLQGPWERGKGRHKHRKRRTWHLLHQPLLDSKLLKKYRAVISYAVNIQGSSLKNGILQMPGWTASMMKFVPPTQTKGVKDEKQDPLKN